jgi:hypothetical protein
VSERDRRPHRGDLGLLRILNHEEIKKLKYGTFQQVEQILVTKPENYDGVEKGTAFYRYVYSVKM